MQFRDMQMSGPWHGRQSGAYMHPAWTYGSGLNNLEHLRLREPSHYAGFQMTEHKTPFGDNWRMPVPVWPGAQMMRWPPFDEKRHMRMTPKETADGEEVSQTETYPGDTGPIDPDPEDEQGQSGSGGGSHQDGSGFMSEDESQRARQWLAEQNLNEFGDPLDTQYENGTPLFSEASGQYMPWADYILSRYPRRPWNS